MHALSTARPRAAKDNRFAIAWYTEAQDTPRTQLVFSTDGGVTVSKPIRVSTGNSFGHVSAALDDQGSAFVSWIEEAKARMGSYSWPVTLPAPVLPAL